jgi:hypothetical protein
MSSRENGHRMGCHEFEGLEAQIKLEPESHDYRDLWNKPTPSFKFATPADVEHRRVSR